MKKLVAASIIIAVIVLGYGFTLLRNQPAPAVESFSEEDLLRAITNEFPSFLSDGEPVITVSSVSSFDDKWYIVSISSLREVKNHVPVRIVLMRLNDSSNILRVMAGPEVYFSSSEISGLNLPDPVILELQKT